MKPKSLVIVLIAACGLMFAKPALAQKENSARIDHSTGGYDQSEEEVKVKISAGFESSTGDYGQANSTDIWYFPVVTKATYRNWTARLTVPYMRIKGPGTVIGGVVICRDISGKEDDCSVVNPGATVTTESGLGDIIGALTYMIDIQKYDVFLDFTGKIKFPTADEDKRLGTGETDYTIQMDATKMFGRAYIFGGIGRKFVGDNAQFQLDDIWLVNAGSDYQVNKKFGIGASYNFRESASTAEDANEATGFVTYKVTDSVTAMLYGVIGFSDGSPDESVGLQFSYKF
jgi:hypothetical protein